MILGSHNSWSYLSPKKWWMKLIKFTAKCQDVDIFKQYSKYGIRCFDLRVRFDDNKVNVVHGKIIYNISYNELYNQLKQLNSYKDVYIRLVHDVRTKEELIRPGEIRDFQEFCCMMETSFPDIKFWCGKNLFNGEIDYTFEFKPTCEEKCASVCSPKLIDDWYPRYFAYKNNKKILKEGTDKDILSIDFVNYGH